MHVVETLTQLENALKDEVAELLIVNWLAVQTYKAMIEENTFFYEWNVRYKNVCRKIRANYYIMEFNQNKSYLLIYKEGHF